MSGRPATGPVAVALGDQPRQHRALLAGDAFQEFRHATAGPSSASHGQLSSASTSRGATVAKGGHPGVWRTLGPSLAEPSLAGSGSAPDPSQVAPVESSSGLLLEDGAVRSLAEALTQPQGLAPAAAAGIAVRL